MKTAVPSRNAVMLTTTIKWHDPRKNSYSSCGHYTSQELYIKTFNVTFVSRRTSVPYSVPPSLFALSRQMKTFPCIVGKNVKSALACFFVFDL